MSSSTGEPALPAGKHLAVSERYGGAYAALGFAVLLAGVDFATHSLNLSILYAIPMYVIAMRLPAAWAALVGLLLVIATFAGLLYGARPPGLGTVAALLDNYRMVNRSFAAVAIIITALVAAWQRHWSANLVVQAEKDAVIQDHPIYSDMISQVRFLTTLFIAMGITVSLVAVDWTTVAEFNLPILYAVPLVLCVLSGSMRAIWLMTPVLLVFTWAGFWASDDKMQVATIHPLVNRGIATAMLLVLAIVGTYVSRSLGRNA